MKIKENLKKASVLVVLAITISSCMEKKYEWSATVCAPREYPVEVYTGAAGGYFFSQMGGFSNSGWGGGGRINDIKAPLPERLDMTWLSYVDNKFYTGDWKLPTEKIEQLFDEGFYSKRGAQAETAPYQSINIGLGPKGMVVVWVRAGVHRQVEVARFQAHETTINPKLITEDEKYMFKEDYAKRSLTYEGTISKDVREQIQQHGYPAPEVYEAYREKYLWKPKVILPEGCKITSLYIKMCNGEIENPYDRPIDQKHRAIPFSFEIYWSIGSGKIEQEFVSRIAFTNDTEFWAKYLKNNGEDEIPVDFPKNEIRELFKKHIDKNKPVEMVIKIDPTKQEDNKWVTDFYIEQGENKYNLNQICQDSGKLN
ncbi:DUF2931 family protein [Flavobacterium daemonense]|uniref:DUF2931 family protein n=1 Tax=Flavobacterium daemonense TaxID=1393049 RepID=UPI001184D03C|nr:DUF2931 family protein [Flavobacterium daemonense]KAF2336834.1 DUF2931 family protein [Flavobacterium daemonense]